MRSLRPLLLLSPLLTVFSAASLTGCGGAHLLARGFDAVTAPGVPVRVRAKFERAGVDVRRARVVFTVEGRAITDLTDIDGVGQATVRLPKVGVYDVRATLPEHERSDAHARLFVTSRPVVVVDIDGTLSAAGLLSAAIKGDRAKTFPGAPELLRDIAKQYQIVYLSARDDAFNLKTRAFLSLHAFPTGPVLFNDWGLRTAEERAQLRASRHGEFKLKAIQQLQAHGLKVVFGIGDAETDDEAYRAAKIRSFIHSQGDLTEGGTGPHAVFGTYQDLRSTLARVGLYPRSETPAEPR